MEIIVKSARFHLLPAVQLLQLYRGRAKIVFADPPFNIGRKYDVCDDDIEDDEYLEFTESWMLAATNALADDGSLWVNIPDRWAANVVLLARNVCDLHMENWCIWHYRFGQNRPSRFISSKCHALWFSCGRPIVNVDTAHVQSDRAAFYNDARTRIDNGYRMDLDVWGFDKYWGRVQGNNRERRPLHDNQLPEVYLERVVRLCSNGGDLVVDPFCGSGTTATVSVALGRQCATGDISEAYLRSAAERCQMGAIRV